MRTRSRRLSRASLVAVLLTLFVSSLGGTASAASPRVIPLVDCYLQNSNGTFTILLGYQNQDTSTRTIPIGSNNYVTPWSYNSSGQVPTVFQPGEQHGAGKLTVSQSDVYSGTLSWYLDGTTLNYWSLAQTLGPCTSAQLPAYANGAALVVLLLLAGTAGVLLVRRAGRRSAAAAGS